MSNDLTIQRTAEAVESPLVINSILESGVRNAPEQEIVYADQRRMSYRDLEERVNRLAGALAECGVKPGDTVTIDQVVVEAFIVYGRFVVEVLEVFEVFEVF